MTKELERAGLPTALICTIVPLAASLGPNRIVGAKAVPHPLGNPAVTREEERDLRRRIVRSALEALQTDAQGQLIVRLESA